LNLCGVGDATGVGVGLGDTSGVVFLWTRFGFGEGMGDWTAKAGVPLSTAEGACVLLGVGCFNGEEDSGGVPVSSWD
jgi:hypothetical protein